LRALNTIAGMERALAVPQLHPNRLRRGRANRHTKATAVKPTIEKAAISCHSTKAQ
jgi:hypothetical protein